MTFREKLQQEHPECCDTLCSGGCFGCPVEYGYEQSEHCPEGMNMNCERCWSREIENDLLKIDNISVGILEAPAQDMITREQKRDLMELVWDIQDRGEHHVSIDNYNVNAIPSLAVRVIKGGFDTESVSQKYCIYEIFGCDDVEKYHKVMEKLRKLLPDAATPESNKEKNCTSPL